MCVLFQCLEMNVLSETGLTRISMAIKKNLYDVILLSLKKILFRIISTYL